MEIFLSYVVPALVAIVLLIAFFGGDLLQSWREPKTDTIEVKRGEWWQAKEHRTADLPFDEDPPTDRPADPDKIYKTAEESQR